MEYDNIFVRLKGETIDDTLFRLGTLKDKKEIDVTWPEIGDVINNLFNKNLTDSYWRKRFRSFKKTTNVNVPLICDTELDDRLKQSMRDLEKQRIRMRSEAKTMRQQLSKQATFESLLEIMEEKIPKIAPMQPMVFIKDDVNEKKAVYALLSDIHYGLSFKSFYGDYNPTIARNRVMDYANSIICIGKESKANVCYVSMLGDMISGFAHQTIRLENAENIIDQVIHVSELIAEFIYALSLHFDAVYVNNVSGNHSRIDISADNSLRAERLDIMIPWYAKARLQAVNNVVFCDNDKDTSFAMFDIFGKNYLSVHGDYDNTKDSVARIKEALGVPIHYFLVAHMHVPEMRFDNTGFIRNGAIVSGGDDFTTKKRLFGPAMQICMVCTEKGVEEIHPIKL